MIDHRCRLHGLPHDGHANLVNLRVLRGLRFQKQPWRRASMGLTPVLNLCGCSNIQRGSFRLERLSRSGIPVSAQCPGIHCPTARKVELSASKNHAPDWYFWQIRMTVQTSICGTIVSREHFFTVISPSTP